MTLKLVGLQEIAELLGITPVTLRTWRHRNKLPKEDYVVSGNPIWEYNNFKNYVGQDQWLIEHSTKEVRQWD